MHINPSNSYHFNQYKSSLPAFGNQKKIKNSDNDVNIKEIMDIETSYNTAIQDLCEKAEKTDISAENFYYRLNYLQEARNLELMRLQSLY